MKNRIKQQQKQSHLVTEHTTSALSGHFSDHSELIQPYQLMYALTVSHFEIELTNIIFPVCLIPDFTISFEGSLYYLPIN